MQRGAWRGRSNLGSTPTAAAARRGLEDRRVKLGCVMPGESPAVFGDALRRSLAWKSILAEKEPLDLDPHQVRQAETQKQAADGAVTARLPETCQWLLVPEQANPSAAITWQAVRLLGSDALAVRASKKLRNYESLVLSLGSTILRKHLDAVPLWRSDHVAVEQLVEDFARYLYLPRIKSFAP